MIVLERHVRQRRPRVKADQHLAFIRTLSCLVSGRTDGIEAAHIRYTEPRFGKFNPGIGSKPSDVWTVPLNSEFHRTRPDAQHNMNEREFWRKHKIDPCIVALALWAHSGDYDTAERIIQYAREAR